MFQNNNTDRIYVFQVDCDKWSKRRKGSRCQVSLCKLQLMKLIVSVHRELSLVQSAMALHIEDKWVSQHGEALLVALGPHAYVTA